MDVGSARAVVIDIGGGSTEITLGTATSTQAAKSFKIGVIRLTERFVKSDPLSGRDEQKLTKHVLNEIDRHCDQITAAGFDRVIGTSGTILSLGTVATAIAERRGVQDVDGARTTVDIQVTAFPWGPVHAGGDGNPFEHRSSVVIRSDSVEDTRGGARVTQGARPEGAVRCHCPIVEPHVVG